MKIKAIISLLLLLSLTLSVAMSCSPRLNDSGKVTLTDSDGRTVSIPENARVVCGYGSFAECWLLSGGILVGVTDDAVSERGLNLPEGTAIVGSVKSIDLELLLASRPDLVILSADLTAHRQLELELSDRGIATALFRVDSFEDYSEMMRQFCAANGGEQPFERYVTEVGRDIDRIKSAIPPDSSPERVLVMRAYSGGIKVKTDNLAEDIAAELGCISLAREYPSLLTDLSVEAIITSSPDIILVLTMGDEESAAGYLKSYFEENPALSSLDAVKGGRVYLLPKELFHYKPNDKWNESYEYLAKILYPEIFG